MNFDKQIDYTRKKIAAAPIKNFAVPHLVIDDVLSADLVDRINADWPADNFIPEVEGNFIFQLSQKNYGGLSAREGEFWRSFNEDFWPSVVAACAEALAPVAGCVFGDIYADKFSLEWPLTLMQASPAYVGHSKHTHFYHCPHWAFTMLLYIDPKDEVSRGTALHALMPRNGHADRIGDISNYGLDDLDWRVKTAMSTMHWDEGNTYQERVADYRANRLFVFLDGPLALHSVPFDNADHTPDPGRALDGGAHARRRILRSHTKVSAHSFYREHLSILPSFFAKRRFAKTMAPNAKLSPRGERYLDTVVRPFFRERLEAYARATTQPRPQTAKPEYRFRELIRTNLP